MWRADERRVPCSVGSLAACTDCELGSDLKCRFSRRDLLVFVATFLLFCVPAVIGVVRSGYGWWLLGWLGFALFFFGHLILAVCPHCVNFSCPLNRVPRRVVDAYLARNPVMREAWERCGWTLGA